MGENQGIEARVAPASYGFHGLLATHGVRGIECEQAVVRLENDAVRKGLGLRHCQSVHDNGQLVIDTFRGPVFRWVRVSVEHNVRHRRQI